MARVRRSLFALVLTVVAVQGQAAVSPDGARSAADADFERLGVLRFSELRKTRSPAPAPTAVPRPAFSRTSDVDELMSLLPARSETKAGLWDSPVNLVFLGSEEAVRGAIVAAGWTPATRSLTRSMARGLLHLVTMESLDVFPPVTAEYLFGRPQDLAFVRQVEFLQSRHHFRLWRAPFSGPAGEPVWVGTANFDVALEFVDRRTATVNARGVVHRIDPDIDQERDYIESTLILGGRAGRAFFAPHPHGVRSGEDSNGSPYRTDGRVLVMSFGRPAVD